MKLAKGEKKQSGPTKKLELELEAIIVEHLAVMEKHTGISKSELTTIALKRYISQHKDYFPDDYKV